MLTFAIGDIHGCVEQMGDMMDMIADYAGDRERKVIFLGDYIDRGPASKGVLDILMAYPEFILLRGNHEEMLLDAYRGDLGDIANFEYNGGFATMRSFGVKRVQDIPAEYIEFIKTRTRYYYEDDLRIFVHAGINPNITDMSKQEPFLMTWIREPFLDMRPPFFKYVVHGHTPCRTGKPDIRDNRCNLDTFCFYGYPLTCGVFDDTQAAPIDILQVSKK